MSWFRKATFGGIASAAVVSAAVPGVSYWEGRSLRAYQDIVGVWTICEGITKGVKPGDVATSAECDRRLAQELQEHAQGLSACIDDKAERQLSVRSSMALLSWTYNVGVGAACRSTLVRKLNQQDWKAVCPELKRWVNAGGKKIRGLVRRREAEYADCIVGMEEVKLL